MGEGNTKQADTKKQCSYFQEQVSSILIISVKLVLILRVSKDENLIVGTILITKVMIELKNIHRFSLSADKSHLKFRKRISCLTAHENLFQNKLSFNGKFEPAYS